MLKLIDNNCLFFLELRYENLNFKDILLSKSIYRAFNFEFLKLEIKTRIIRKEFYKKHIL